MSTYKTHLDIMAMSVRAMNHPLRQAIIDLLVDEGELNVTDIYGKLNIEQSVASQQLKILRDAEIANTDRRGKEIYYSINDDRLESFVKFGMELQPERE